MPRKMTGPEHAQAALDYLAEAQALATRAERATSREWKEAYSAQASACADIAAAEFQAAHLALKVVATPFRNRDQRQAKEWRDITGVSW